MSPYVTLIGTIIAGAFALVSAYFAYSLRNIDGKRQTQLAERKSKITDFTEAYALFETAIYQIKNQEAYSLQEKFTQMNSRMQLLASDKVCEQYFKCSMQLEKWSQSMESCGGSAITCGGSGIKGEDADRVNVQSPDPRQKYHDQAEVEFVELQEQLARLTDLLRECLQDED